MTDYFALFGEPRRPWLEPEALKEKFHALSAKHHPDVRARAGAGATAVDFATLNAAYHTLRDPKARLRHLLELQSPETLIGGSSSSSDHQIPPDLAEMFMQMSKLRAALGAFLARQAQAASPLALALLAADKLALREQLERGLAQLNDHQRALLDRLRALDPGWQENALSIVGELAAMYRRLAYLSKWTSQIHEGIAKLNFL